MNPRTVREALVHARALGVERLDAQALIGHLLKRDRAWVLSHDDHRLDEQSAAALAALLGCRAAGEPLAYLVGEREFHGLRLEVTPDVLVPRPDTETLVDLGTGSGAIALAVKRGCPRAEVHGSDLSEAALAVARRNGQRLGLAVDWHRGTWWQAVVTHRFDLALSNPPYVAPGDPHLAALVHEPGTALVPVDDPGDGLADIERIVAGAGAHLNRSGWLLIEHGFDQSNAVRQSLRSAGFHGPVTRADLAGQPRTTGASYRP
jgi:release factor glutamine methyltransferase